MTRPTARALVVTVTALVAVAGGSTTATAGVAARSSHRHAPYLSDARGDVVGDTGYHCGSDPNVDITRVDVTRHGRRALVVSTRYASIAGRWVDVEFVTVRTPAFAWDVEIQQHAQGRTRVVVDTPHGQKDTTAATTRIDRRAREMVLTVPWRLIRDPRWARVGVRATREDTCGGGGEGNDLAGLRGAGSSAAEFHPPLGHRVRRR